MKKDPQALMNSDRSETKYSKDVLSILNSLKISQLKSQRRMRVSFVL